jgi:thymidylate kinase
MAASVPSATAMSVLRAIDVIARERILVFGSLPPHGRDIDLLVSRTDEDTIISYLRETGYEHCKNKWLLFRDCSACVLELVQAGDWTLPPSELESLFADATPLNGFSRVVEPSPHHVLLILSRKLGKRGRLGSKQRSRIERALAKNSAAWDLAERSATDWNTEAALAHIRRLYEGRSRCLRMPAGLPRRSRIIALSGIDGAGKSSQAESLREALDRLGRHAVIEWSPAHVISLNVVARPIRKLLGYGPQSTLPDRVNPDLRPSAYPTVVVHTWVTIAAFATALSLWRAVWSHLGRGRVVICDRYTLDFATFLAYRHGIKHKLRFQRWLLRTAAPRPMTAYLLDVPPEVALARKKDQYVLPELRRQAALYRSFSTEFNVLTLDGEQPVDALCKEIAFDAWRKLERCASEG